MQLYRLDLLEPRRLFAAGLGGVEPSDAVNVHGLTYFTANDGVHGLELWKSDGTAAGTKMVRDITPGSDGTNIAAMFSVGDHLVFVSIDGKSKNGSSVWTSDGTPSGTFRLTRAGPISYRSFGAVVNGRFIYCAMDTTLANPVPAICASDGTPSGTEVLEDLSTQSRVEIDSLGSHAVVSGEKLLISTDGTSAGTVDLSHAPGLTSPLGTVFNQGVVDNKLYFASDQTYFAVTDGTLNGTTLLAGAVSDFRMRDTRYLDHSIYFSTTGTDPNDPKGYSLWTTNGTVAGTVKLGNFEQVFLSFEDPELNGKLIFSVIESKDHNGLWSSDGTVAGTHRLLSTTGDFLSSAASLCAVGDQIFFQTNYQMGVSDELWRTDGTPQGTQMIQTFTAQSEFENALEVDPFDGQVVVHRPNQKLTFDPSVYDAPTGPNKASIELSAGGALRIFGTSGDDVIKLYDVSGDPARFIVNANGIRRSFAFADVNRISIYGYSGNDNIGVNKTAGAFKARLHIWGGDGNDTLAGGGGRDTIEGQAGNDWIFGDNNNDVLSGGDGDDTLIGGNGDDSANGDNGSDSIQGNKGDDFVSGGYDRSKDQIDGNDGTNILFGHGAVDSLLAGTSADKFVTA